MNLEDAALLLWTLGVVAQKMDKILPQEKDTHSFLTQYADAES